MRTPHGSRLAAIPRVVKRVQQLTLASGVVQIIQGSLKGESYLTPLEAPP